MTPFRPRWVPKGPSPSNPAWGPAHRIEQLSSFLSAVTAVTRSLSSMFAPPMFVRLSKGDLSATAFCAPCAAVDMRRGEIFHKYQITVQISSLVPSCSQSEVQNVTLQPSTPSSEYMEGGQRLGYPVSLPRRQDCLPPIR